LLTFYLMWKHFRMFTNPSHQKHICRILLMVPIYAIDSFISFRFYWLSIFSDVIRDCYEAFVIHTFVMLLMEFIGGYHHGKEIFSNRDEFTLPIPLCCFKFHPKRGLLRYVKRLTLQYVFIRPLMTITIVILHATGNYCPGNWSPIHGYVWIEAINFVSVTIAMYGLVLFYVLSKNDIQQYKPIPKFLSIKFVIFLSFWQSIVISGLVYVKLIKASTYWTVDNVSDGVQNACICAEMLIASALHIKAFTYKEYERTGIDKELPPTSVWQSFKHTFDPSDIAHDLYDSFAKGKKQAKKAPRFSNVFDQDTPTGGITMETRE